jgi:ketosteroid isomerase-like protein
MNTNNTLSARQIVHEFLYRLGEGNDVDGWLALLSPDVVVDTPFAPKGAPIHFEGLKEIGHRFGDARRPMQALKFFDIEILSTEDPERWVATCKSEGILSDGSRYKNQYCWMLRIRDNHVVWWCEYYDPQELMAISQDFRPDC